LNWFVGIPYQGATARFTLTAHGLATDDAPVMRTSAHGWRTEFVFHTMSLITVSAFAALTPPSDTLGIGGTVVVVVGAVVEVVLVVEVVVVLVEVVVGGDVVEVVVDVSGGAQGTVEELAVPP
jgi:hypothetical protein